MLVFTGKIGYQRQDPLSLKLNDVNLKKKRLYKPFRIRLLTLCVQKGKLKNDNQLASSCIKSTVISTSRRIIFLKALLLILRVVDNKIEDYLVLFIVMIFVHFG